MDYFLLRNVFILHQSQQTCECIFYRNYPNKCRGKICTNAAINNRKDLVKAVLQALGLEELSYSQDVQLDLINRKPAFRIELPCGNLWPVFMAEKSNYIFGCTVFNSSSHGEDSECVSQCETVLSHGGSALEFLNEFSNYFIEQGKRLGCATPLSQSSQTEPPTQHKVQANLLLQLTTCFLNGLCPHGRVILNQRHAIQYLLQAQRDTFTISRNPSVSGKNDERQSRFALPAWKLSSPGLTFSGEDPSGSKLGAFVRFSLTETMNAVLFDGPLRHNMENECNGLLQCLAHQLPISTTELKLTLAIPPVAPHFQEEMPAIFMDGSFHGVSSPGTYHLPGCGRALVSCVHHPLVIYSDYSSGYVKSGQSQDSRSPSQLQEPATTSITLRCFVTPEPVDLLHYRVVHNRCLPVLGQYEMELTEPPSGVAAPLSATVQRVRFHFRLSYVAPTLVSGGQPLRIIFNLPQLAGRPPLAMKPAAEKQKSSNPESTLEQESRWVLPDRSKEGGLNLSQGALRPCQGNTALQWEVRTDKPVEMRGYLLFRLNPTAAAVLQSRGDAAVNPELAAGKGSFYVRQNCYAQVHFQFKGNVFSGAVIDDKNIYATLEKDTKVIVERTFQSGTYRIWNSLGDCPVELTTENLGLLKKVSPV